MSYELYHRHNCNIAMQKETSIRLDPHGIIEANFTPFDLFDELEIPEPDKDFEELFPVHSGRDVGNIGDKGYAVADGSLEMNLQSGRLLYYILGASVDVLTTYWTHTITGANVLPTFVLHFEQLNYQGAGARDIVKDLLGCIATELVISAKKDDLVKQSLSFLVPKKADGAKFTATTWTTFNLTVKAINWEMTERTVFTVNSEDITTYPVESIDITISNEIDWLPDLGDPYFVEPKIGKREIEIKMMIFPKDDGLRVARDLHPEDYAGALTITFNRGTNDVIIVEFTDLYVSEYPNKVPNIDDKEVGLEITLRASPGNITTVTVEDQLDETYYDGVDDT